MAWNELSASYDVVANAYEKRFTDELDAKPRDRELLESYAQSAADPVLDLGCGPGQIGLLVRQHGRRVMGIDLSPEMAELARHRLGAALVADMRALPVGDARVGGLLAFYSLIHVPRSQLVPVLREFHRVLKPEGRVLLSAHEGRGQFETDRFLDQPVPFVATLFELDELVDACGAAGLAVTLAERRPPYPTESATFRLYVGARRP